MAIHFDESRWAAVRQAHDAWWEHTLERPLMCVQLEGMDPGRPQPAAPYLTQETALDLSWTADELVDRIDYELSKLDYLGDAYPYFGMECFGPGVLAAFLGARPDNRTGKIWFFPQEELELSDMHFSYDPDNLWFNRVKDIYRAANRRWHGAVVMGMVDLGGVLDVLATFRGTENLLMDLYDEPEEVKRLTKEIHDLWIRYYNELCDVIEEGGGGHSDWSRIYSSTRSYIVQCDFCYMISNPMFREFVKDELAQYTGELDRVMYHLDGPGELKHLDDLLTIEKLRAVQWIPGDAHASQSQWPEVYQKIHRAGKNIQMFESYDCVRAVQEQIGTGKGINYLNLLANGRVEDRAMHVENLRSFGLDVH